MRRWKQELFRLLIVVALGAGLAAVASGPKKARIASLPRPAPIILATAMDADPPAQCLLPPRDKGGERLIGEKSSDKPGHRNQKKVIACG